MKNTTAGMTFLALLFCGTAQAAKKNIPVEAFTAVSAQQGINLTIKCASAPALVVSGSQDTLNKFQVTNQSGNLLLNNRAAEDDRFVSNTLNITLYTSQPLTALSGKAGVKIDAEACSVSPAQLSVKGSMGTDIRAAGKTDELQLELAMGGSFNRKPADFSAKSATVRMSMGAETALCHIPRITGTLAAGARMSVSPSANVDTGSAGTFASEVSTSDCA